MKKCIAFLIVVFFANVARADDYITQNITGACEGNYAYKPVFDVNSYTCSAGQYLPANGIACTSCPNNATCAGGNYTFDEHNDQGVVMNNIFTQDITGACKEDFGYKPVFEINSYTCSAGTYLPADGLGCVACPNGATCGGGTYTYNPIFAQGIVMPDTITQNMTNACENGSYAYKPYFTANSYNCASGTYLPADGVACATCLADNYCPGGTYTFNETTNQGINACDTGLTSPAGSSSVSDCVTSKIQCTSGQYLPANADACVACPTGYTCAGGAFDMDNIDQGLVANNISITWKNEDGTTLTTNTCTYGQPITIPANPTKTGYTFNGWTVVNQ